MGMGLYQASFTARSSGHVLMRHQNELSISRLQWPVFHLAFCSSPWVFFSGLSILELVFCRAWLHGTGRRCRSVRRSVNLVRCAFSTLLSFASSDPASKPPPPLQQTSAPNGRRFASTRSVVFHLLGPQRWKMNTQTLAFCSMFLAVSCTVWSTLFRSPNCSRNPEPTSSQILCLGQNAPHQGLGLLHSIDRLIGTRTLELGSVCLWLNMGIGL